MNVQVTVVFHELVHTLVTHGLLITSANPPVRSWQTNLKIGGLYCHLK